MYNNFVTRVTKSNSPFEQSWTIFNNQYNKDSKNFLDWPIWAKLDHEIKQIELLPFFLDTLYINLFKVLSETQFQNV